MCTLGQCSGGQCVGTPVVCDDAAPCRFLNGTSCSDYWRCGRYTGQGAYCDDDCDPCTMELCDAEAGCVHPPAPAGMYCDDDGLHCTLDVCDAAGACTHPPLICEDADACTIDGCDPVLICSGGTAHTPVDCDDHDACTADGCDPSTGCVHTQLCYTPAPTVTPTPTVAVTATVIATDTVTPTAAPTPTSPCAPAPDAGCRKPLVPSKSQIALRDKHPDSGDLLTWTWTKGTATTKAEFGDPLTTTSYTLCIYDETGGTPAAVLAAHVPAGSACGSRACWKERRRGFDYTDKGATRAGVTKLVLREGGAGAAKIILRAKGPNVDMPGEDPPGEGALPLRQDARVTVQLTNGTGVCWGAEYTQPAIANDAARFRDKE